MNEELRTKGLDRIRESTPYSEMEVVYRGTTRKMPVHEIPLNLLVHNKYNGRIASKVKSYEKQNREIDAANADDHVLLQKFLMESHKPRNKQTFDDLSKNGQMKYGIVTRDGVIIDGNRRAMLLGKLAKDKKLTPGYFKAVILDDRIHDNPGEILRLETTYQLGEDEKLGYNATEKYLKVKDLLDLKFPPKDIGDMMGGISESDVNEIRDIMALMDQYLDTMDYSGIYTRLDGTEGIFVDLNGYLARYKKGQGMADWLFTPKDISDLKSVFFDLIRARFSDESKSYRSVGRPSKEDSFFCKKEVWEKFRDSHFAALDPIRENEKSIEAIRLENPGKDLEVLLLQRDEDWSKSVTSKIKENIGTTDSLLKDINDRNAPAKQLKRVLKILETIDSTTAAFLEDSDVEQLVSEINSLTWEYKQSFKKARKNV